MSDLDPLSPTALAALDEERILVEESVERKARVAARLASLLGPGSGFAVSATSSNGGEGDNRDGGESGLDAAGSARDALAGSASAQGATTTATGGLAWTNTKVAILSVGMLALGATAGIAVDRSVSSRSAPAPLLVERSAPHSPTESHGAAAPQASGPSSGGDDGSNMRVEDLPSVAANSNRQPARDTGAASSATADARSSGSAPANTDLTKERSLIDAARAGVSRGHPSAALEAVERHQRLFPNGQLREEREGIRILALVADDRLVEARAHAARFRKAYPESVLLPAIDHALSRQ